MAKHLRKRTIGEEAKAAWLVFIGMPWPHIVPCLYGFTAFPFLCIFLIATSHAWLWLLVNVAAHALFLYLLGLLYNRVYHVDTTFHWYLKSAAITSACSLGIAIFALIS